MRTIFKIGKYNENTNSISVKDLGVTTGKLADNAITTAKITDANVTNAKLQNSSITVTDASSSTAISLGGSITFAAGAGLDVDENSGTITYSSELATETNAGIATFDGTDFTVTSGDVTLNDERIEDIVGAMVSTNTEDGISVTYADGAAGAGKLNFDIDDSLSLIHI